MEAKRGGDMIGEYLWFGEDSVVGNSVLISTHVVFGDNYKRWIDIYRVIDDVIYLWQESVTKLSFKELDTLDFITG